MRWSVRLVVLLLAATAIWPGQSSAMTRLAPDPGAGPLCDHLYCVAPWGFTSLPGPGGGAVVLTTANGSRYAPTEMSVNPRYFPEAAQTITVRDSVTFDAAHLWNNGMTLLTPAGLDAVRTLGPNFQSAGNDGLEYRPQSASVPVTLTMTLYRLPAALGDAFNLASSGAQQVAQASSPTQVEVSQQSPKKPMTVLFPSPVTLIPGTYLATYRFSDAPEELLTVFMAAQSNGTLEAGSLTNEPSMDYPPGAAYLRSSYGNGSGGRAFTTLLGPDDFVLLMARVSNNGLPDAVKYAPGDVLLDFTMTPTAATPKSPLPKTKKACLKKPGYRWDATHRRCVRSR